MAHKKWNIRALNYGRTAKLENSSRTRTT